MQVELGEGALRQIREGHDELAGLRVGTDRPRQLDVGAEAVGGEDQPVAIARLRVAEVDAAGDRRRQRRAVRRTVPTFENSGQWASSSVPIADSSSLQEILPSAAFGLIEKPSGRVTVVALISDGDGVLGLSSCGTLRSTSSPEAVSVSSVSGWAARLGLKLSWSQPVVSGQGPWLRGHAVVVGDHFERCGQCARAGRSGLQERDQRAVRRGRTGNRVGPPFAESLTVVGRVGRDAPEGLFERRTGKRLTGPLTVASSP